MANMIVGFSKIEEAKSIRNLLVRNGYDVISSCTTGSQILAATEGLIDGIIICGFRLNDMLFNELYESLPPNFDMLMVASDRVLKEFDCSKIMTLSTPLKVNDLLNTVEMMNESAMRRHRKLRSRPKERNAEDQALIQEAKLLLMSRNNMSEEEAHRYMQKCSMDSSTNKVETARMILSLMKG